MKYRKSNPPVCQLNFFNQTLPISTYKTVMIFEKLAANGSINGSYIRNSLHMLSGNVKAV